MESDKSQTKFPKFRANEGQTYQGQILMYLIFFQVGRVYVGHFTTVTYEGHNPKRATVLLSNKLINN